MNFNDNTMSRQYSNTFFGTLKSFSKSFWIANTMELFERWAFYGFFMLFANYLTLSTDTGALGLSQTQKGIIMGFGTAILYLLPIITGAIADRIGYKKTLLIAYTVYLLSFLIMPLCRTFMAVFINYIFLAIGASLFKPIISATVARTTNAETSSIGFGIFYMMVNIGAFIGPLVALQFSDTAFQMVFYISAALIGVNILVLLLFKEPERERNSDAFGQSLSRIFKNILTALSDLKLVVFLIIVSGFWTMYYQLFFSLSVFINQWVDTATVFNKIQFFWPWLANKIGSPDGTIQAEYFTNMDALFIITFQLIVSTIVMKWRPINSIITGFVISSVGLGLALMTNNGFFLIFSIFIFGIGEMAGSPKITEYIGRIAPKDKVALYMGCSFLPVFLGSFFAGIVAGPVYEKVADKTSFIKSEILERQIQLPENLTQNELFLNAANNFGMTERELTQYLWDKYHPSNIWYIVVAIGLTAALCMWIYDKFLLKSKMQ